MKPDSPDPAIHLGTGGSSGSLGTPKAVEKDPVSFIATVSNGEQQHGEGVAGEGGEKQRVLAWFCSEA